MIDHIGIVVGELARSKAFFIQGLDPLGIALLVEISAAQTGGSAHAGFGADGRPFFWIGDGRKTAGPVHIAFAAPTRSAVDAFYAAAIVAGGTDNGAPGPRPQYHPDYYGAFILDPDGNNVEAVCRGAA